MIKRLKLWFWVLAVSFTQSVFNTFGAGLWWVLTGRGSAPNPDEPLSSRVGRNAIAGKKWALFAEKVIDDIFGKDHCRNSFLDGMS